MKRNYYFVIAAVIVAATLIATIIIYPRLPNQVPAHWNFQGVIDRYDRRETVFILPAVMAGMMLLFAALPWLSPKRFEVDTFRSTYLYIMVLLVVLLAYLHGTMLWAAFAKPLEMGRSALGALFLFLLLTGNVLGRVKRNFYIGVRTPWTLASDKVWYATHRFAARAFVGAGFLGLISVIVGARPLFGFSILIAAAVASTVHSLVYYKKLQRRGEL